MKHLSFAQMRVVNAARSKAWHGRGGKVRKQDEWNAADWSNAMCGEAGEVANAVKKLRRLQTRIVSSKGPKTIEEAKAEIAKEMADTVLYLDLLADHLGIDLGAAVIAKFNEISDREGFPHRLRGSRK